MDEERRAFLEEAKRNYATGMLHGLLADAAKQGHLLHVEAHHEGDQPTGDLVVRVAAFGGAYRVRLEPLAEEERF